MLSEICAELRNYFLAHREKDIYIGTFTVRNGNIQSLDDVLQDGQYFRIVGSVFNDGVYQYPCNDLLSETFRGAVWAMSVPPAVISYSEKVDAWKTSNADKLSSPYNSESFGGYSYTKANGVDGGAFGWKDAFPDEWRMMKQLYGKIRVL